MISEEERKKYVEFMYNPENEYNCDECPENKEINTRCKLCVRLR